MPNYLISQGVGKVILRNYEGVITTYTEPMDYKNETAIANDVRLKTEGVSALMCGKADSISLEPDNLDRKKRNEKH